MDHSEKMINIVLGSTKSLIKISAVYFIVYVSLIGLGNLFDQDLSFFKQLALIVFSICLYEFVFRNIFVQAKEDGSKDLKKVQGSEKVVDIVEGKDDE